jgi:hypothetical protein
MATSAALTNNRIFPSGVTVGAYPRTAAAFPPHGRPETGVAPTGSPTATDAADATGCNVTGLTAGAPYVLSAEVNSVWRHVSCVLDA